MRTIRTAAALLAAADSLHALEPTLTALGFATPAEPLDRTTRTALGIPAAFHDAAIARGAGALRALVLRAPAHLPMRDAVKRIAIRLASSSPHILWMLVVADEHMGQLAFAAWSTDRSTPRIAALVIERSRIVDSDAETMCALAAAQTELDALTHTRWLEILSRESITRRFYRTLERLVEALGASLPGRVPVDDRAELALLCTSRLLFLSFLEAKGWLDGDRGFLARTFDDCAASGGHYHRRVLLPLLHGTLNTPRSSRSPTARAFGRIPFLNGGLFARTPVERRHRSLLFPDENLGALFSELLSRYRFTAREDSTTWSEAAIDPEMLGKAFESVMASRERRTSGAYYTPQPLVDAVTTSALTHGLVRADFPAGAIESLLSASHGVGASRMPPIFAAGSPAGAALRDRLHHLRVIDPACGSGAFLVHALERIADMHAALGDTGDVVGIRRAVLTRTIFGVDRNPFAVWLCELRLWLSMVIESTNEDPAAVPPLPNLDHHIRIGDALSGDGLAPLAVTVDPAMPRQHAGSGPAIARLRARYVRATGPRKQSLARELDRAERARAIAMVDAALATNGRRRRDLLSAVRSPDLFGDRRSAAAGAAKALLELRTQARGLRAARRAVSGGTLPFSFATHFADAASAGGFDIVVGNPPWVRLHRIPRETRTALRERFAVFRNPGWERGAAAAHAGVGFAAQVDLAALFVERSLELLRPGGAFSLLLPSKLWHSLAGGSLRRLVLEHATPREIEDLGESPHAFDAAVYPSILTAVRHDPQPTSIPEVVAGPLPTIGAAEPASRAALPVDGAAVPTIGAPVTSLLATVTRRSSRMRWEIPGTRLGFDGDTASPWLILPSEVRTAFDRLTSTGTMLAESVFGRPLLGVKCGCNGAFLVTTRDTVSTVSTVGNDNARMANGRCCAGADGDHGDHDDRGDHGDRGEHGDPHGPCEHQRSAPLEIEAPGRRGRIERELVRPLIRGESLRAWRLDASASPNRILWPHDARGAPLRALPPLARHWLLPWRRRLIARTDGGGRGHWWTLFRTESARTDLPRVVWADMGRSPRAMILDAGDPAVALNSCYVARCPTLADAHALAALLNGPLATAWLNCIAEPARGGFRRYLGWTMSLLPMPHDWPRARALLAPLGSRGTVGEPVATCELLDAALAAYGVDAAEVEPLLTWTAH